MPEHLVLGAFKDRPLKGMSAKAVTQDGPTGISQYGCSNATPQEMPAGVVGAPSGRSGLRRSHAGKRRNGVTPHSAVRSLIQDVASLTVGDDRAGLIDQLRQLEELKCAIVGAQARIAVAFDVAERRAQADAGVPRSEQGQGVAAQIALARGESPSRGSRLLGLARALVTEMPHTLAALETGQLNEWRATVLVRETACLAAADRCAVDEELAADSGTFVGAGDRMITAAARTAAYRRDPESVARRVSRAVTERCVSLRPAPDTMTYLTALLPVAQGVGVYAALTRHADSQRSQGDTRTRGQLMADELVERTTGSPAGVCGVELQLVMTDRALLRGDSEPAHLTGYGIVPADWARSMLDPDQDCTPGQDSVSGPVSGSGQNTDPGQDRDRQHLLRPDGFLDADPSLEPVLPPDRGQDLKVWLRKLYTAPGTGDLLAAESRSRLFTAGQRRFIQARDRSCRTPYCDAPIRHYDHVVPWQNAGLTSLQNGAGLCEACNHTKEIRGWRAGTRAGPTHTMDLRTPTGHTYTSTAPPTLGSGPGTGPVAVEPGAGPHEVRAAADRARSAPHRDESANTSDEFVDRRYAAPPTFAAASALRC